MVERKEEGGAYWSRREENNVDWVPEPVRFKLGNHTTNVAPKMVPHPPLIENALTATSITKGAIFNKVTPLTCTVYHITASGK